MGLSKLLQVSGWSFLIHCMLSWVQQLFGYAVESWKCYPFLVGSKVVTLGKWSLYQGYLREIHGNYAKLSHVEKQDKMQNIKK